MTIDILPDIALLEIFDFYVVDADVTDWENGEDAWHTLVHVCRKWRSVVFGSPLRLNLRLHCRAGTPVKETLDVWPRLPIIVQTWRSDNEKWGVDNIVAVLEHNDRIRMLVFNYLHSCQLERVLAAMQQPFPALTDLRLQFKDGGAAPAIPASFMGGSAGPLRRLNLEGIPFPGLPKLLLSATHLVSLYLYNIPHSGYISPEVVVTCLSVLTRLEYLAIKFESPRSYPERKGRRSPRTLLPVLGEFTFGGVVEYLEDLVARIDAPLLFNFDISLFHQLILDTPQLTELCQFIGRTPKLKTRHKADLRFSNESAYVALESQEATVCLGMSCRHSYWQLSFLTQICSLSSSQGFISRAAVESIYILEDEYLPPRWYDDIEGSQWLELLRPFTAAKTLNISRDFTPCFAPALQELVGERATEVLPALETLLLEETPSSGPVQEAIEKFVAARQLASHPIAVSRWEREKDGPSYESAKGNNETDVD